MVLVKTNKIIFSLPNNYVYVIQFVDDDDKCYLENNYTFDIRKNWLWSIAKVTGRRVTYYVFIIVSFLCLLFVLDLISSYIGSSVFASFICVDIFFGSLRYSFQSIF